MIFLAPESMMEHASEEDAYMTDSLREGLPYKVWNTGGDIFRIGAVIAPSKVVHGGNIHFLPMLYDTEEDAQQDLAMLLEQASEGGIT